MNLKSCWPGEDAYISYDFGLAFTLERKWRKCMKRKVQANALETVHFLKNQMHNNEAFRKTLASWLLIHDPASVKRSNNKGSRKQHVCPKNISVPRTWHIFRWFHVHGQTRCASILHDQLFYIAILSVDDLFVTNAITNSNMLLR